MGGQQAFTPPRLPDQYVMPYDSLNIMMGGGPVAEVRFERPSPYKFRDKVGFGSSLADVLQAIGQPKSTVDGGPNGFQEGVLYKNIDKQPGRGYYQRSDVGVWMFLLDNAVTALYLIPPRK